MIAIRNIFGWYKVVVKNQNMKCSVDGCDKKSSSKGMCSVHYSRLKKSGRLHLITNMGEGDTKEERFWSRVDKTTDCWIWNGSINGRGYGRLGYNGIIILAHRLSWFLTHGEMPKGIVMHSCDNRLCVNPSHLSEGTCKDNTQDMIRKGRHCHGTKVNGVRLNEDLVKVIRIKLSEGAKIAHLAREYEVSAFAIHSIKRMKTWKHVS